MQMGGRPMGPHGGHMPGHPHMGDHPGMGGHNMGGPGMGGPGMGGPGMGGPGMGGPGMGGHMRNMGGPPHNRGMGHMNQGGIPMGVVGNKNMRPGPNFHGGGMHSGEVILRSGTTLINKLPSFSKRAESSGPAVTVFVGNITERAPEVMIRQILNTCGPVLSWKRVQGASGKLQGE